MLREEEGFEQQKRKSLKLFLILMKKQIKKNYYFNYLHEFELNTESGVLCGND